MQKIYVFDRKNLVFEVIYWEINSFCILFPTYI